MIEIVDNKTGSTVGNALCYFALVNSKTAFIIDNIEIKNSEKLSSEASIDLRNTITTYAKNIAQDVTENDKTEIFLGNAYNDVITKDLKKELVNKRIHILGEFTEKEIYLDALRGYIGAKSLEKNKLAKLYKLN